MTSMMQKYDNYLLTNRHTHRHMQANVSFYIGMHRCKCLTTFYYSASA